MTLGSQQARSRSGRSSVSGTFKRRKQRNRIRFAAVGASAALVVLLVIIWMFRTIFGEPSVQERNVAMTTPSGEPARTIESEAPKAAPVRTARSETRPKTEAKPTPEPDPTREAATTPPTIVMRTRPADEDPPKTQAEPASARRQLEPMAEVSEPQRREAAPERRSTARRSGLEGRMADAIALAGRNRPIMARAQFNEILTERNATADQRRVARAQIAKINELLVFGSLAISTDPLSESYVVKSGDSLSRIASRRGLAVDHRFLARINGMRNPNAIRENQELKLVRGPFHAVVHKSAFRLDLYAGDPPAAADASRPDGTEAGWMYIRSFDVGLGSGDGTPIGNFVIKPRSKVANPGWRNPRTGETFAPDDPTNPIGEYWLAIEGLDEVSKAHRSLGLHGTTEPESIGTEMSMGCVRLHAADIELVWEMLAEGVSVVRILP